MTDFTPLLHAKVIDLGRLAIRATTAAGSGHPTIALSLAHLVAVLMHCVIRWTPADPSNPGSDRLALSEGHAVPIIYAACADLGVAFQPDGKRRAMTEHDVMTLREIGSAIDGHGKLRGATASQRAAGPPPTCSIMSVCRCRRSSPQRNGWLVDCGVRTRASNPRSNVTRRVAVNPIPDLARDLGGSK